MSAVLEPLADFKRHSLYPAAVETVERCLDEQGPTAARVKAQQIAEAMTDSYLERRLREARRK